MGLEITRVPNTRFHALAPSTSNRYCSTIHGYYEFCEDMQLAPFAGNPVMMARFVAWLGNVGTIKAPMRPYMLVAVNKFYIEHGRDSVALRDLVERVRRGLSASHVTLTPTLIRVPPPTEVARRTLTRAEELRTEFLTTEGAPPPKIELLRACIATFVLFVFSSRGRAELSALHVTSLSHSKVES
jgi:hypothetical protein